MINVNFYLKLILAHELYLKMRVRLKNKSIATIFYDIKLFFDITTILGTLTCKISCPDLLAIHFSLHIKWYEHLLHHVLPYLFPEHILPLWIILR